MFHMDEEQTRAALDWPSLISGIGKAYLLGCEMPERHHHTFNVPGEADGTLLLMPAWVPGEVLGVKMVTVVPGNSTRGLPAIAGAYLISCAKTGQLLGHMDGAELTARRTAATSAYAASYLGRKDAKKHIVLGAGRLSLNLLEAHAAVQSIESVQVWARRTEQAQQVVDEANRRGYNAHVATDLPTAIHEADIVSSCTLATEPLIKGEWLAPGTHLDLVGAFTPKMRETDDDAVLKSRVYADTLAGVLNEGGDIVQPINAGIITPSHIVGDLYGLVHGTVVGRQSDDEITMYKSVGAALQDLAAAQIALQAAQK